MGIHYDDKAQPISLSQEKLPKLKNLSAVMAVYAQGVEDLRWEILNSGFKEEYRLEFLKDNDRFQRMAERMVDNFSSDEKRVRESIKNYKRRSHER